MSDATDVLVAARDLIAEPERWTQGSPARDAQGNRTGWGAPAAVCWCAVGAVEKAAESATALSGRRSVLVEAAMSELRHAIGRHAIFLFNDSHSHAEVLAAFDKAIAERT